MKLLAFLEPFVFGALLSGLMSFIVSGIESWNAFGFVPTFTIQWLEGWLFPWAVAFPTVLVVAPAVRRLTKLVVAPRPTTFAAN